MTLEAKFAHASRFAQYLRKNGDKVIGGTSKLTLTTSALCLLNNLFAEVLSQERGEWPTDPKHGDVVADVKYLFDFMKRTSFLKLFHTGQTLRGGVDLSQFSNLTVLELRKIPAHLIIGLESIAVQLKALICSRSIYLLKEIFGHCINEDEDPVTWTELKELNLSYNYLEILDNSLKCLPNVEVLDLSHNRLNVLTEIQILKNLVYVNLSYNEMDHMPVFHTSSCRSLAKLCLRNNNLENLDGIDCLFNLEELDISYNLLSDYDALNPLDKLKALKVVNFEGNPLYFHKKHASLVLNYLHPYALKRGVLLNGKLISKPHNRTTHVHHETAANHHQTSINTVVGDAETVNFVCPDSNHVSKSFSRISEKSFFSEEEVAPPVSRESDEVPIVSTDPEKSKRKSKGAKKKMAREVLINEQNTEESIQQSDNSADIVPSHVKAKEMFEARRQERGESWLMPDNAFKRIMIPVPQVPSNTPMSSCIETPKILEQDLVSKVKNALAPPLETAPPTHYEMPEVLDTIEIDDHESPGVVESNDGAVKNAVESNNGAVKNAVESNNGAVKNAVELNDESTGDVEVNNGAVKDAVEVNAVGPGGTVNNDGPRKISVVMNGVKVTMEEEEFVLNKDDLDVYGDIYKNTDPYEEDTTEAMESDEETEDSIFIVLKRVGTELRTVTLHIGPNYIKERDAFCGKLIDRIDLNALLSVQTEFKNEGVLHLCEVSLEIDTVKTSRQKRCYLFENCEAGKLVAKTLQPFADARTLKEATLGALQCMKCNSQFSQQGAAKRVIKMKKPLLNKDIYSSSCDSDKEYPVEVNACPNCGNHILVEMDTIPMPAAEPYPAVATYRNNTDKSSTKSSGSSTSGKIFSSLVSALKISPILKRKSVSSGQNSQPSAEPPARSKETSEEDESPMRRNSSDITIISQTSLFPESETNLNTILERESQASLSPPMSLEGISQSMHGMFEADLHSNAAEPSLIITYESQIPTSENEPDFYSLTESYGEENTSVFTATEATSEKYLSPFASTGSLNFDSSSAENKGSRVFDFLRRLEENDKVTSSYFSRIDHRLKLHLEFHVFSVEEELVSCLHTCVVPLRTGEEFSGLLAITTQKLFIFKFLPQYSHILEQNDPLDKVVQVVSVCGFHELRQAKVLFGHQGLSIVCGPMKSPQVFTLVIRDTEICKAFLTLLTDFMRNRSQTLEILPCSGDLLQLINDHVFSCLESERMPEILQHQFAFWWNTQSGEQDSNVPVCSIVTSNEIFVTKILYTKQESSHNLKNLLAYHYSLVDHQKLSDLTIVKFKDVRSVELSFVNESSQENVTVWTLRFETKSSLNTFIGTLKSPLEEIFQIPFSCLCEVEESL